jgi:inositol phosphorylceramide mannosyltransferase catalytic subunit
VRRDIGEFGGAGWLWVNCAKWSCGQAARLRYLGRVLIPRNIFQTCRCKQGLHAVIRENVDFLKRNNPGWRYCLYDDEEILDFIGSNYEKRIGDAYLRINPAYGAARSDYFRYLLLYKLGGLYLDIKSSACKPLDSVIRPDDAFLLSRWKCANGKHSAHGIDDEYQQWFIASEAGHPFLRAVINLVTENILAYRPFANGVGRIGVLATTGPIAYSKAILPLVGNSKCRFIETDEIGFSYSIFAEKQHRKLVSKHYSKLKSPVILPDRGSVTAKIHQMAVALCFSILKVATNLSRAGRRVSALYQRIERKHG